MNLQGPRAGLSRWCIAAVFTAGLLGWPANGLARQLRLRDLDNHLVDPLQADPNDKAIVLIFISIDCPISNRYAPVVQRLYDSFGSKRVIFRLVYPNPLETTAAIRSHLKAFGYRAQALRDPRQELVKLAHATVTPEAAVFAPGGALLYHGRIDDRYVSLAAERPTPTIHDLEDVLTAILAGKPITHPVTQAVGCFLADLIR